MVSTLMVEPSIFVLIISMVAVSTASVPLLGPTLVVEVIPVSTKSFIPVGWTKPLTLSATSS